MVLIDGDGSIAVSFPFLKPLALDHGEFTTTTTKDCPPPPVSLPRDLAHRRGSLPSLLSLVATEGGRQNAARPPGIVAARIWSPRPAWRTSEPSWRPRVVVLRRPQQVALAGVGLPPHPCGRQGDGVRQLWCTVASRTPTPDLMATYCRHHLISVHWWSPGAVAVSCLKVGVEVGTREICGRLCGAVGGDAYGFLYIK